MAVDNDGGALNVGAELTVDRTVGVADRATSDSMLTADLANLRHVVDLHLAGRLPLAIHKLANYSTRYL